MRWLRDSRSTGDLRGHYADGTVQRALVASSSKICPYMEQTSEEHRSGIRKIWLMLLL